MVWGGMIALSTIARLQADQIFPHLAEIEKTMEAGSVITNDAGIKMLADIAACKEEYRLQIVPYLLKRFETSRPVDAPRYAERIFPAAGAAFQAEFLKILKKRMESASNSRLARLNKVLKQAEKAA
jgi:hypothetical protein